MPKRLTITVPHALGAAEVRRRIDLHMDWAFRRLEAEKIRVEAEDWLGNRRAFSGSGYGQTARSPRSAREQRLRRCSRTRRA
ncbi:hypothetical protein OMR07_16380 [Methylobacterium organophilum]|nr:hypothetical protein [Methylobacterium organophilum]